MSSICDWFKEQLGLFSIINFCDIEHYMHINLKSLSIIFKNVEIHGVISRLFVTKTDFALW